MIRMKTKTRVMVLVCGLVGTANVLLFLFRPSVLSLDDETYSSYEPLKLPDEDIDVAEKIKQDIHASITTESSKTPRDNKLKARSNTNKFLIHSYIRGGGGVLSEAFNLHVDDMFFLYQPLYKMEGEGPSTGIEVLSMNKALEALTWLKDAFNCSFQGHDSLIHAPYLWKSHSIRNTYRRSCQEKRTKITKCLEEACMGRQLRAAYTVRLGLDIITELIKQYKTQFKVVMVIRDPRAILSARRREGLGPTLDSPLTFKQQAALLCSSMAADIKLAMELATRFPGSIMILRYEHLLMQPLEVLTHLYNFLGLEASYTHLYKVIRILKLDRSQEALIQVLKAWQVEMTLRESRAVDNGCMHHYDTLGYFPVPTTIKDKDRYFLTWEDARAREDG